MNNILNNGERAKRISYNFNLAEINLINPLTEILQQLNTVELRILLIKFVACISVVQNIDWEREKGRCRYVFVTLISQKAVLSKLMYFSRNLTRTYLICAFIWNWLSNYDMIAYINISITLHYKKKIEEVEKSSLEQTIQPFRKCSRGAESHWSLRNYFTVLNFIFIPSFQVKFQSKPSDTVITEW